MELELKHLLAYFPYELVVKVKKQNILTNEIMTDLEYLDEGIIDVFAADSWWDIQDVKPILKPMKNLTTKELKLADFLTNELKIQTNYCKIENFPHELKQYLLSQHYDIFGLIDAGLAVEK